MSELLEELKMLMSKLEPEKVHYIFVGLDKLDIDELDEFAEYAINHTKHCSAIYPIRFTYNILLDSNIPRLQLLAINSLYTTYKPCNHKVSTNSESDNHTIQLSFLNHLKVEFTMDFTLINNGYCKTYTYLYYNIFMTSIDCFTLIPFFVIDQLMSNLDGLNSCINKNETVDLFVIFSKWTKEYIPNYIKYVNRSIENGKFDKSDIPNPNQINTSIKFFEMMEYNSKIHAWSSEYNKLMIEYKKFLMDNDLMEKKNVFPLIKK